MFGIDEDEKHFLFDCSHYLLERDRMFQDIGVNLRNLNVEEKFKTIFEHPFKLGRYIRAAIYKRRQQLYNVN